MQRIVGGFRPYLLLALVCLGLYLPGIAAVPPIDRDESRFAQASHQMLESGDYVRIRFQDQARAKKPVGVYWLQAAAARVTGAENAIWAYRLPSVLGALIAVLLTFHFGQTLAGRTGALIAAGLLAGCLILVSEAHQAKTDAVLLATVVAAQGILGRLYLADREAAPPVGRGTALAFWIAQGIGILVKGPITPVVSLLTILFLGLADKRLGWLKGIRPLTGLLVAGAIVAPWAIAISSATGGQFIGQAVKTDLLPKLLGSQESHGAPPGYFLLLATATLWPASLFAGPALIRAVKLRKTPAIRFCLAWIVPAWVMFEIVPTKLPHYVLPTYPALALLAGLLVAGDDPIFAKIGARLYQVLAGLIGPALAVAAIVLAYRVGGGLSVSLVATAVLAVAAGVVPVWLAWRGRLRHAVGAAVVGAVLTYAGITGFVLPSLDGFWLSRGIAAAVPRGTPVAAAGYHEPSLVFLLGTDTELTDGAGAAAFLLDKPDGVAVIEAADQPIFLATLTAHGSGAERVAEAKGWNYSRGRPADLSLWRLKR